MLVRGPMLVRDVIRNVSVMSCALCTLVRNGELRACSVLLARNVVSCACSLYVGEECCELRVRSLYVGEECCELRALALVP